MKSWYGEHVIVAPVTVWIETSFGEHAMAIGAKGYAERKVLRESRHITGERITVERVGKGYIGNDYNRDVHYLYCKYRGSGVAEQKFEFEHLANIIFDAKRDPKEDVITFTEEKAA